MKNRRRELLRYLLGKLSAEERTKLEERYLMDGDYFEQLLDAEDELIHQYVRGKLSGRERRLFEKHFLAIPQNLEKVKLAQMLNAHLTKEQRPEAPAWRERMAARLNAVAEFFTVRTAALKWAYAMAMAVMFVSTSLLFIKTNELGEHITQLESERQAFVKNETDLRAQIETQREQSEALAAKLQNEQSRRAELERKPRPSMRLQRPLFTITLQPGIFRGAPGANQIDRTQIARAEQLQIQLRLENPKVYESYRVFLETAGEDTIWSQYQLQPQQTDKGQALVLLLPASIFSENEYLLTVQGVMAAREIELVNSYDLRIVSE